MSVTISHKKMTEIREELNKYIINDKDQESLYNFLKEKLKYDSEKVYYNNERYEKYVKPYREKNREALNKKRVEKYNKEKNINQSLENIITNEDLKNTLVDEDLKNKIEENLKKIKL